MYRLFSGVIFAIAVAQLGCRGSDNRGSGVVLIDTNGARRIVMLVTADGTVKIERFGPDGKPLP